MWELDLKVKYKHYQMGSLIRGMLALASPSTYPWTDYDELIASGVRCLFVRDLAAFMLIIDTCQQEEGGTGVPYGRKRGQTCSASVARSGNPQFAV